MCTAFSAYGDTSEGGRGRAGGEVSSRSLQNPPLTHSDSSEEDERLESNFGGVGVPVAVIEDAFSDQRSFRCQLVKSVLRSGDSAAALSPEDISYVAAMGDALSTGLGLWQGAQLEFRGAAFSVGGDATIDGLVTFPSECTEAGRTVINNDYEHASILVELNKSLCSVSHVRFSEKLGSSSADPSEFAGPTWPRTGPKSRFNSPWSWTQVCAQFWTPIFSKSP